MDQRIGKVCIFISFWHASETHCDASADIARIVSSDYDQLRRPSGGDVHSTSAFFWFNMILLDKTKQSVAKFSLFLFSLSFMCKVLVSCVKLEWNDYFDLNIYKHTSQFNRKYMNEYI